MNVVLVPGPGIPVGSLVSELGDLGIAVAVAQLEVIAEATGRAAPALVVLDGASAAGTRAAAAALEPLRKRIRLAARPCETASPAEILSAGADDILTQLTAPEVAARLAVARRLLAVSGDAAILENANDTIYTVSLDGRFLSANAEAEALTGYPRTELLGMHLGRLVAPEHVPLAEANIRAKLMGEAQSSMFEVDIIRADGRRVPIEISSRLLREEGRVVAIEGIARDLTHRRQMESEIAFRAQLLEIANAAAYAGDAEGRIVYWNRGAELLFGFSRDEALGQNVLEMLVPREHWRRSVRDLSSLTAGKAVEGEFELLKASGERFPAYVTNTPILDGNQKIAAVVAVCLDLTERKRQERELERLATERALLGDIVESAHDAIIGRDDQDRVISWNAGAERLFATRRTKSSGQTVS